MVTGDALSRCRRHLPVFGIVQTIPNTVHTELAIWSGFDFVILDCEHGVIDEAVHLACLQILTASSSFGAVRVRAGDFGAVGRYAEFGADAILLPGLRTQADAAAFVAAAAEGPRGTRSSTGASRAARYGLGGERLQPLLLAMIESAEAVANAGVIAATPGIDGLVIGPSDLSADLGQPGVYDSARYADAIAAVEQAAARATSILGTRPAPFYPVERLIAAGHHFLVVGSDVTSLRDGYRALLASVRGAQ